MELLGPILSAAFAAGGAWVAVRIELRWTRRDVDELRDWRAEHEREHKAARIHGRL